MNFNEAIAEAYKGKNVIPCGGGHNYVSVIGGRLELNDGSVYLPSKDDLILEWEVYKKPRIKDLKKGQKFIYEG